MAEHGQDYLYAACMNQRYIQIGLALILMVVVLSLLGADLDSPHSWAVWSILALTVVLEYLAYIQGINRGIEMYLTLTPEQQQEINRIIRDNEE